MNTYSFKITVEKNGIRTQEYHFYSRFLSALKDIKISRRKNVYHYDIPYRKKSSWFPLILLKEWGNTFSIMKAKEEYYKLLNNIDAEDFYIEGIEETEKWKIDNKNDIFAVITYTANKDMKKEIEDILKVFNVIGEF